MLDGEVDGGWALGSGRSPVAMADSLPLVWRTDTVESVPAIASLFFDFLFWNIFFLRFVSMGEEAKWTVRCRVWEIQQQDNCRCRGSLGRINAVC